MTPITVQPLTSLGSVSSWLGNIISSGLTNAVAPTIANVTSYVLPIFIVASMICIAYFGWTVSIGEPHRPVAELLQIMFKLILIAAILNGGYYAQTLSSVMIAMPDEIMGAVTGSQTSSLSQIDNLTNQSTQAATATQARAPNGLTSPVQGFLFAAVSFCFTIVGAIFGVIAAILLTAMKTGMALIVMIGPFFIAAAFFQDIKKYFDNWKNVAVFFSLAGALFMLALTIVLQMMAAVDVAIINTLTGSGDVNILGIFAAFLAVSIASFFLLLLPFKIATAVTGSGLTLSIPIPFLGNVQL
ncbi:type IV secretion system protein [Bordetella sp. FB-8]|uniref:type IV secretion system protein n=1 Tax=Bordetella sp. FB-8 TaxID=1159870 RepID=UPI000376195F|nr:type IV secretion system protein [Bordetella sp. FB-8]